MKKTPCIILVTLMMITACQTRTKIIPVDSIAAKNSVTKVLEKYHSAMNAKDANTVISILSNDGLYCGTDSKDFWDKPTHSNNISRMFADTSLVLKYKIDKREIRIAVDGNSAISVEQCFILAFSQKIPIRMVSHLVKTGNDWLIDFSSTTFIPNNEDIGKLNKAVE